MKKQLKIQILVDKNSWILKYAAKLAGLLRLKNHKARIITSERKAKRGDILIILGWWRILKKETLNLNKHNLVVHESALPQGKGWSPLTWQILEGKNRIPITLFEAVEKVDSGPVYFQDIMKFEGHELVDELRKQQGEKTVELILKFVSAYPKITRKEQKGRMTFYPRRTPKDSELDIKKTIQQQFNLLRVADNERYPLFFRYRGHKYILKIFKEENE